MLFRVQLMAGRQIAETDGIFWEGNRYVVILWYANADKTLRYPKYVLPLETVRHQWFDDPKSPIQAFLSDPLPEELFGPYPSRQLRRQFGVIAGPAIELPLAQNRH